MGSISAWLPSRRSTLHQTGGDWITLPGQVRSAMGTGLKAWYLEDGLVSMMVSRTGHGTRIGTEYLLGRLMG